MLPEDLTFKEAEQNADAGPAESWGPDRSFRSPPGKAQRPKETRVPGKAM